MTTFNSSRSNSPTLSSASGTRSRSTSASQFGQKLKGLFKFTHTNPSSTHNKSSSSQHSSSTEHLPRVPTPPSHNGGGGATQSPYFTPLSSTTSHHCANGTSTGQSSADGMDSLGGDSFNASELEDAIHTASVVTVEESKPSPPLSPTSALKRQLRRVASAPNTHGLLNGLTSKNGAAATLTTNINSTQSVDSRKVSPMAPPPPRPPTADGIPPQGLTGDAKKNGYLLPVPPIRDQERPGRLQKTGAFRRTYSSNSIKVRNVEVGPSSFEKIKLLGKGRCRESLPRQRKEIKSTLRNERSSPLPPFPPKLVLILFFSIE